MKKILKNVFFAFILFLFVALSVRAILLMPKVWVESIANTQTFGMAVHISSHPELKDTYLVTAKEGRVFLVKEGDVNSKKILDHSEIVHASTLEEGMLSSVIDPKSPKDLYIYYCAKGDDIENRLSRFKLNEHDEVIQDSEEIILSFLKPRTGHNGGYMEFGEDGYLWLGLGDNAYSFIKKTDELDRKIFGNIIRIDVRNKSGEKAYAIPSDNPFINNPDIPNETWVMGLRNPWRWSFIDKETIIIGDVGDRKHEEISIAKKADHLGWPYVEGGACSKHYPKCDKDKYKAPMTYFSRNTLRSITGGYVYRGKAIDFLKGKYVFGDYLRGLMALPMDNPPKYVENLFTSKYDQIFPKIPIAFGPEKGTNIHPVSFYQDKNKELLMVDLNGAIFRIIPLDLWTKIRSFFFLFGSFR